MEEKYYRLVEVDAPAQQEYRPTTKLDVINNAITSFSITGLFLGVMYFLYKARIETSTPVKEDISDDREEPAGEA